MKISAILLLVMLTSSAVLADEYFSRDDPDRHFRKLGRYMLNHIPEEYRLNHDIRELREGGPSLITFEKQGTSDNYKIGAFVYRTQPEYHGDHIHLKFYCIKFHFLEHATHCQYHIPNFGQHHRYKYDTRKEAERACNIAP